MKCHQAQDLMYLYRPGEMTVERRRELEKHLASCPVCSAESKAALQTEKNVSEARNIEPRLEGAARLTRVIMKAAAESRRQPVDILGALSDRTASPAFRLAACVALFVISGTFFVQTAVDARKVATLEEQLRSHSTPPVIIGLQDFQRAGVFLPGTETIAALPESSGTSGSNNTRHRRGPGMSAILQALWGGRGPNETYFTDYMAKKYPRLASIRIDDGLDGGEREILASDGEAFIKDMETLIQKGGVYHDR
jgi:hypothetical protein